MCDVWEHDHGEQCGHVWSSVSVCRWLLEPWRLWAKQSWALEHFMGFEVLLPVLFVSAGKTFLPRPVMTSILPVSSVKAVPSCLLSLGGCPTLGLH